MISPSLASGTRMLYRVSIKSLGLPSVSLLLLRWPFSVHRQYRVCISREKKKKRGGERCVCVGVGWETERIRRLHRKISQEFKTLNPRSLTLWKKFTDFTWNRKRIEKHNLFNYFYTISILLYTTVTVQCLNHTTSNMPQQAANT